MWTRRRVRENTGKPEPRKLLPLRQDKEKGEDIVAFGRTLPLFQEGVKVNLLIRTMQFFDTLPGPTLPT